MKILDNRRGRQYSLDPLKEIRNKNVGYVAAILDEARERCIDLIQDMEEQAMWNCPAETPFSAGLLVVHMNWAEYRWLPRIGRHQLPENTIQVLERGSLNRLYEADGWNMSVPALVSLCRETREKLMIPCLQEVADLDLEIHRRTPEERGPRTVRQILMHVIASWIYHSGQVGLITMQNGIDYQWALS